jgi:hypothetical protein
VPRASGESQTAIAIERSVSVVFGNKISRLKV